MADEAAAEAPAAAEDAPSAEEPAPEVAAEVEAAADAPEAAEPAAAAPAAADAPETAAAADGAAPAAADGAAPEERLFGRSPDADGVDLDFDLVMEESLAKNEYPAEKMAAASAAEHTSLAAQFCTPEIWEQYKDAKSTGKAAWTIARAINSGVSYPSSFVGCHAGDRESYDDFKDFFYPVIEAYHKGFSMEVGSQLEGTASERMDPAKIAVDLTESAHSKIISTRIRVARNLSMYPLNPGGDRASREEIAALMAKVYAGLPDSAPELAGDFFLHSTMSDEQRQALVDGHQLFRGKDAMQAASGYHVAWPHGRGVFHNPDKSFVNWVNEGDHLRIISMQNGGDVKQVFARLSAGAKAIEDGVKKATGEEGEVFMMHPKFGAVTCCPSNIGTGMRGSVHILVPKLIATIGFDAIDKLCRERNCQARGSSGEHSAVVDRIDVSNWRRIGFPEFELVQDMITCANFLAEEEDKTPEPPAAVAAPQLPSTLLSVAAVGEGQLHSSVSGFSEAFEDIAAMEARSAVMDEGKTVVYVSTKPKADGAADDAPELVAVLLVDVQPAAVADATNGVSEDAVVTALSDFVEPATEAAVEAAAEAPADAEVAAAKPVPAEGGDAPAKGEAAAAPAKGGGDAAAAPAEGEAAPAAAEGEPAADAAAPADAAEAAATAPALIDVVVFVDVEDSAAWSDGFWAHADARKGMCNEELTEAYKATDGLPKVCYVLRSVDASKLGAFFAEHADHLSTLGETAERRKLQVAGAVPEYVAPTEEEAAEAAAAAAAGGAEGDESVAAEDSLVAAVSAEEAELREAADGARRMEEGRNAAEKQRQAEMQELYMEALAERTLQTKKNVELSGKVLSHLAKIKKDDDEVEEGGGGFSEKSMADNQLQFEKMMVVIDTLREELFSCQEESDERLGLMKGRRDEREGEANELELQFIEFKREVSKGARDTRTTKPLPVALIARFEELDTEKELEVKQVRLRHINYKATLKTLERTLKKKEELAKGLHLMDFEQLKIENQTLNEKIEERNEELLKLQKKTMTTVQVLTHVKEKLQFVQQQVGLQQEDLGGLEHDLTAARDTLTRLKHDRDELKSETAKLKGANGLMGSDAILDDFEAKGESVEELKVKVEGLRKKNAEYTRTVKMAKQAQASMIQTGTSGFGGTGASFGGAGQDMGIPGVGNY